MYCGAAAYIATLRYDDATPTKAASWAEKHVASGGEKDFGSAHFRIFGEDASRYLEITALGWKP